LCATSWFAIILKLTILHGDKNEKKTTGYISTINSR